MEMEPSTTIAIVTLVLSVVAIVIAVLTYRVEHRSAKIQHLMPSLDRVTRVLQDVSSSSLHVQLLKETIPRLRENIQKRNLTALPFVKMFALACAFGMQSVFMLNQNCEEFLTMLRELKDTGSFERIRKMDSSLAWEMLQLEDASMAFLKLDIVPLSKTEDLLKAAVTVRLLEEVCENAIRVRDMSGTCLKKLDRLLP